MPALRASYDARKMQKFVTKLNSKLQSVDAEAARSLQRDVSWKVAAAQPVPTESDFVPLGAAAAPAPAPAGSYRAALNIQDKQLSQAENVQPVLQPVADEPGEDLPAPHLDHSSSASAPIPPSNGTTCLLTGDRIERPQPAASGPAAYRSESRLLAWAKGMLWTWAAALTSVALPAATAAPPPPRDIPLEERWIYLFNCLEAAAKLGRNTTYAAADRA